ncbi:nucleoside phosphorylase domain-containing protein [Xylaria scruposa]|nr:nucleoside phosphorylase domain-containing protein [Xylaria scruposa]
MAPLTQKTHNDYSVAILCALALERDAVRYMLDEEHQRLRTQPGDPNSYVLGRLHDHNVVLACLPSQQGKGAAATVATNMSRSFPLVKWRLFVGIGGGVPSDRHPIRLGDVVISMPYGEYGGVVQYDLGRETNSGFELKGFLWPPPAILRNAAQDMQSDHRVQSNKIEDYLEVMLTKWPRLVDYKQPSMPDVLFDESYPHVPDAPTCDGHCDLSHTIDRPARELSGPIIHYGLIASGDSVVKNPEIRDRIARSAGRDALCFEMEAAGLMTEFPAIVIRGISDYADSHKNHDWQHYAAATAAACAKELLSYVDPEQPPRYETSASSNVFTGQGIQNTGSVNIGNDFNVSG